MTLFPLGKNSQAPPDLSDPIRSPAKRLREASAGIPAGDALTGGTRQISDFSPAVGECSPPRLHVSAAPPAASAGEEKGVSGVYAESPPTATENPLILATSERKVCGCSEHRRHRLQQMEPSQ